MPAGSISAGIFFAKILQWWVRTAEPMPRHAEGQSIGTSSTTSSKDSKCG